MSAVYVGAGLDVRPIRALKHISHFIYIDSRPISSCPFVDKDAEIDYNFLRDNTFYDQFCRKNGNITIWDNKWRFQ